MGQCKNCKHWKMDRESYEPIRLCTHPKVVFADGYYVKQAEPGGAAVLDGSGYYACFAPTGEYGCVLHEHKETHNA